jgi:homoserine O-acetyltransferase
VHDTVEEEDGESEADFAPVHNSLFGG